MKFIMSAAMVALSLYSSHSFAFDEFQEEIEVNRPIQIDGEYSQRAKASDRLKRVREKLEKQNELMVQKKIEQLRLKQELEMTKKLQKIFNQQAQALEEL